MNNLTICIGDELFSFPNFASWVATAKRRFRKANVDHYTSICIDAQGRICTTGEQFMRAERENAYPVKVYRI